MYLTCHTRQERAINAKILELTAFLTAPAVGTKQSNRSLSKKLLGQLLGRV